MLSLLLGLCFITATTASGAIWTVDPSGGGDFIHIQDAIDAAASGDEIQVWPGEYIENIDFLGKDLWVHSIADRDETRIYGGLGSFGQWSCVSFRSGETSDAVLEGLTLTGGRGTDYAGALRGGAIVCDHASPTIRGCLLENNRASYAGAIYLDTADVLIEDCIFRSNRAQTYGGAIAGPASSPYIQGCLFEGNLALNGDGTIHLVTPATIVDCVFLNNHARAGGAINAAQYGADVEVQDCLFIGNVAHGNHGGAMRIHECKVSVDDCLFLRNWAIVDGGAILAIDGGQVFLHQSTLYENSALRDGGHIALYGGTHTLTHNILAKASSGGGIMGYQASASFACNDCWANQGGNYLGIYDPTGYDGNISVDPMFCSLAHDDYYLHADSPCAAENNPECGQIGLHPIGCGGFADASDPEHAAKSGLTAILPSLSSDGSRIEFRVSGDRPKSDVSIGIYDATGRLVRTVLQREVTPGAHRADWDRRDEQGGLVPAGVYFCRCRIGEDTFTRQIVCTER